MCLRMVETESMENRRWSSVVWVVGQDPSAIHPSLNVTSSGWPAANDELATTVFSPRVPATTRRPGAQRAPDHRDLASVITVMRHHLQQHRLKRARDYFVALMYGFDLALDFLRRILPQLSEITDHVS